MSRFLTSPMRCWVLMGALVTLAACGKGPGYGTLKATPQQQSSPNLGGPVLQGGNSSGGGDAYAVEFKRIAEDLVAVSNWKDTPVVEGVEIAKLRDAVATTTIKTVEFALHHPDSGRSPEVHPLCLESDPDRMSRQSNLVGGSHRVDAINCPDQKRIILSLVNWRTMGLPSRRALVLHEYLGILKLVDQENRPADRNYEKSYRILSHVNLASTVRDSTVIGPIAQVLIAKINWAASEVTSQEVTDKSGSGTFRFRARFFRLEDADKRVVLACESATGALEGPGSNIPVAPPAECLVTHESFRVQSVRQVEFRIDGKALAAVKARLLPGKIEGISLSETSNGGILTFDLLN